MNSAIVPEGKTVYGFGAQKFKPGQTVNDKQTSPEIIKYLSGKTKKISSRKKATGKLNTRKISL